MYQKSANLGYAKSQFNMGVIYRKGEVVKQDYNKAIEWFEKAAKQGHTKSKFNIAEI